MKIDIKTPASKFADFAFANLKRLLRPNYLVRFWELLRINLWTLVKFELIFKACSVLIFAPLAVGLGNLAMKMTGYKYITLENALGFLIHPVTLLFALILLIVFSFITMFDLGAIIIIFDESYHNDRVSMVNVVKYNFRQCAKLFKLRNIPMAFILLFLLPFLNIGFGSNVITSIRFPGFVTDYIISNRLLLLALIFIYGALLYVFSNLIYLIHYMILERKNFKQASKASRNLVFSHRIGDLLRILLAQFVFLGVLKILIFLGVLGVRALMEIFGNNHMIESVTVSILGFLILVLTLCYLAFASALNYGIMSVLFYRHKETIREPIGEVVVTTPLAKKQIRYLHIWIIAIIILSIGGGTVLTYQVTSGKANMNIEALHETEITAHRGESRYNPENTMAAFRSAADAGVDWIELDVQQTHDGVIMVAHDSSLLRTAGVKDYIYNLDYKDLKDIDVGSHLSKKFAPEYMPTLREVLIFANERKIRLNIEIKPNEHDVAIENAVVSLIDEFYSREYCAISSLRYDTLARVKEIAPDLKTIYTMSLAVGDVDRLEGIDAFSIESSNISSRLVRRLHASGKEIFAWTVNSQEDIGQMINMGVDNIITDRIDTAREVIIRRRSGNVIEEFLTDILGIWL